METTITFLFKLSQLELDTYCLNYKNNEKTQGLVNEDSVESLKSKLFSMIDECVYKGEKIQAIKLYREVTGADLATAKRIIDQRFENLEIKSKSNETNFQKKEDSVNHSQKHDSKLFSMIDECVYKGDKIQAIKIYREATGADLATAKRIVDQRFKQFGIDNKSIEKQLDKDNNRYND